MLSRNSLSICFAVIASLFTASNAFATLVLSFSPSTPNPLVAGGTGTLDVFVRTDSGTQLLDGFQLQLRLTPTGGAPAGGLVFTDPQLDSQLGLGNYVFAGNSLVAQSPGQSVGTVLPGGQVYNGLDGTNNFIPATVTTSGLLVYRLNLSAVTEGNYDLTVDTAQSSFFTDQTDPLSTPILFTSTPITLTVTAVPEPSSIALLSLGLIAAAAKRRRRKISSPPRA